MLIGFNLEYFKMESLLKFVSVMVIIFQGLWIKTVIGTTTVTATAPVNPVESDGIFSLRCEVVKKKPSHEMAIFSKINGNTERLSVDNEVLDTAGERVYLAVRQMSDGSTVYLLSIMKVTRSDEGEYLCKIFDKNNDQQLVAQVSLNLQVMYTPEESDPICSEVDILDVMAGTHIDLSCSSELASPDVNILWRRTGGVKVSEAIQTVQGTRVYSGFTFTPTLDDNNVMFICEISSHVFPDFVQTCHIGPFQVHRNPNIVHRDQPTDSTHAKLPPSVINKNIINKPSSESDNNIKPETGLSSKCQSVCFTQQSSVPYWIISTIVACILTILFFIIGLILVLKFRRLNSKPKQQYYISPHPVDDIYTELECRRGDSTVYMSLGKTAGHVQRGPTLEVVTDVLDKQYDIKQTN